MRRMVTTPACLDLWYFTRNFQCVNTFSVKHKCDIVGCSSEWLDCIHYVMCVGPCVVLFFPLVSHHEPSFGPSIYLLHCLRLSSRLTWPIHPCVTSLLSVSSPCNRSANDYYFPLIASRYVWFITHILDTCSTYKTVSKNVKTKMFRLHLFVTTIKIIT